MPKMDKAEIASRLAQLLEVFSAGGVHCVVLAAAASDESRTVAFGLETNTSDGIARALLQAGLRKVDDVQPVDRPLRNVQLIRAGPRHETGSSD